MPTPPTTNSHHLYVRLTKRQCKEALIREFDNRCIHCGTKQLEYPSWAVVNIINQDTTKDVSIRGEAVICSSCAGRKYGLGVGEYADSLSPRGRTLFILRVLRLTFKRRISAYKAGLFLAEFIPFHLHIKEKAPLEFRYKFENLMYETNRCCIYCGNPLSPPAITYDHILPRALGGKDEPENLVISCRDCNNRRGTMSVDEFVGTFTQARRRHYTKRVTELVRQKRLPSAKARLLLVHVTVPLHHLRFRFLRRIIDIRIQSTPYPSPFAGTKENPYLCLGRVQDRWHPTTPKRLLPQIPTTHRLSPEGTWTFGNASRRPFQAPSASWNSTTMSTCPAVSLRSCSVR